MNVQKLWKVYMRKINKKSKTGAFCSMDPKFLRANHKLHGHLMERRSECSSKFPRGLWITPLHRVKTKYHLNQRKVSVK